MLRRNVIISYTLREAFQRGLARDKIIFLSAGPGWGKTVVVTTLLEKQDTVYVSLGRRPLPGRFPRDRLVILDNFQALPPQAEGQLRNILRRSPPEQRFFLLSRGPMPDCLTPYEAAGALLRLGEADMALDMDCLCQLAQAHGLALPVHELRWLLEETGGCPPAVNLLLTALSAGQPLRRRTMDAMRAKMGAYMEESALGPLPPAARKLLLELSLFDRFDQALADLLAEGADACTELEQIWRISGVIRPDGPLWVFRDRRFLLPYLRQKLRMGPPGRLQALHLAGGRWCAARGDLPGTLCHYQQAGSRERVLDLLIQTARQRPDTGACRALRACAGRLGKEDILQCPDLICTMSMLQSMSLEPEESERWYEALKDYLRRMDRRDKDYKRVWGLRLYLDLCLPHRGAAGLPEVILSVDKLLRSKALALPEIDVTGGLPSLIRGVRDFSQWMPRARELYDAIHGPAERVLGQAGAGVGELALAEGLLEQGEDISGRFPALAALEARLRAGGALELEFVRTALLARALCAAGSPSGAEMLLLRFRGEAAQAGAPRILSGAVTQAGYYGRYLSPFCGPASPLTQKERMVLRLIGQNKSNEEICALMDIKLPTVKTHIHNLLRKLNVSNRNQLQGAAERLKLSY